MSMENGFELDFPGDDDNQELPSWAWPRVVPVAVPGTEIGEPDAASIDEMPRLDGEVYKWV